MNFEYYKELIEKDGLFEEDWYILGIDFGTTNSVVSYWHKGHNRPEPIDMSHGFGKIPMPSVVQYRKDTHEAEWVVGEEALKSIKLYPEATIYSIKRKMGENNAIYLGGKSYLPEEIAGKIIKALIEEIKGLNPKGIIAGVVVSVPYDFDDAAKKATVRACHLAGLSESLICLIEEPKAAALAYNFRHELKKDEKLLVFDFGGGTLDITIFQVMNTIGEAITMKVISEGGESYHGGDNVDALILETLCQWVEEETGKSFLEIGAVNQAELSNLARDIKERLTGVKEMRVPFTFMVPPFIKKFSRDSLESLIHKFINKTRGLVMQTLRESAIGKIEASDISRILLEGGSSAMPWVRELLISILNDEDKIYSSEKPALDIANGATYYAAMKMGLLNHQEIRTFGKTVKFEVTVPHDIGFEINHGSKQTFHPMIKRGTPYALAKKTQVFTLAGDTIKEMTTLDLTILERMNRSDGLEKCRLIGKVHIQGLPERPSGKTHLKVTLSMDEESGLVRGTVEDLGFKGVYESSGFMADFIPDRHESLVLKLTQANQV